MAIDGGAESARASLRALDEDRRLFTLVFVVDGAHLAGQIAMVDLALAEPDTSVRALTTQVVATVTVDTPAEECARLQRHYNLTQLPVGTQTLTLIVGAIALGELVGVAARRLLVREALLGLVHGVWLGVLVAVIAVVWQGSPGLCVVLGVAMLGNMLIAGTAWRRGAAAAAADRHRSGRRFGGDRHDRYTMCSGSCSSSASPAP